ncbi:MAG: amidohydrolase [Synechococcaceae bacterium WBA_2_066]|nr:amidohydrolase [Synechococcaceae bacterium WB6_1A_059]NBP33050.1 amidohydrolase [Synechococcaceae bacterium WB6_1B_055]NBQ19884.1 amidohydrolase [Synechococcaceae bacterium WB5_2A_257]NBY60193.1 amidohydrolase [Synechococcaceae bacterium LLD_019]NCU76017.1 amidohydrolase [Synechococcaceae bacterium WB7_1C_051]NCU92286.1 amidohydrolase [Synechococcaceae bacterium WB7_1B_046]NCY14316.1 amidohydrolase [Synechococcaceae bacterium WB8_1A_041]NDA75556.1 amidohydrolase [Synechococcaceae bacteriu
MSGNNLALGEEELAALLDLRRHLHAHPELSGAEHHTAALVAGELRRLGWRVQEGIGRTGVLAELGPSSGRAIGLRVDMDALPIEECTGLAYASTTPGLMHACGHDIHTAVGLGVAMLLAPLAEQLSGTVRLLFQPAEETAEGARWMLAAGAIEGLSALLGLHVFPSIAVGSIGVRHGALTAAAAELELEVLGEAGHGARPHQAVDAIWIAARLVSGLQEAISRRLDALQPVVLSFGRIEGGRAFNVIADRVRLLGTLRCLDCELYEQLPLWVESTAAAICAAYGGKLKMQWRGIAPPVQNDPALTRLLETIAVEQLGREQVLELAQPSLGAEDFAHYLNHLPGCMFRLGVAGLDGCAPLHHGGFNPDEACMPLAVNLLATTLKRWLEQNNTP